MALPSLGVETVFYSRIEVPTENGRLELELPVGELELELAAPSLDLAPRTRDVTVPRSEEPTPIEFELG